MKERPENLRVIRQRLVLTITQQDLLHISSANGKNQVLHYLDPIICPEITFEIPAFKIEYRLRQKLHRTSGPAMFIIIDDPSGQRRIIYAEYWQNNQLHRLFKPAIIQKSIRDGKMIVAKYYQYGKQHRPGNKPAVLETNSSGFVILKEYWNDGKRHRANGPAVIQINWPNHKIRKEFWNNGQLDRDGGPAILEYQFNGQMVDRQFWKNGQPIDRMSS